MALAIAVLCAPVVALKPTPSAAQSTGAEQRDETPQQAMRRLALEAEERGENDAAQRYWTQLAHDGDVDAMWRLAAPIAEQGVAEPGVVRTRAEAAAREEAFFWLRKSALAGNLKAQRLVAAAYLVGDGVSPNAAAAAVWYRRSATEGDPMSQHSYALLLDQGRGVPRDSAEAQIWFERAAAQDYAPALQRLGRSQPSPLTPSVEAEAPTESDVAQADLRTQDDLELRPNSRPEADASDAIDIFDLLTEEPVDASEDREADREQEPAPETDIAALAPLSHSETIDETALDEMSRETAALGETALDETARDLTDPDVEDANRGQGRAVREERRAEPPPEALSPDAETVDVEASVETTTDLVEAPSASASAEPRTYEITILSDQNRPAAPFRGAAEVNEQDASGLIASNAEVGDGADPAPADLAPTDLVPADLPPPAPAQSALSPSTSAEPTAEEALEEQIAIDASDVVEETEAPTAAPQRRTAAPIASPRPSIRAVVTQQALQQLALPIDADLLLQGAASGVVLAPPPPAATAPSTPPERALSLSPIATTPSYLEPPSLQDALATGDALALRELARRHQLGDGVPRDRAIAFALWRAAARLGDSASATAVANIGAALTREEIARSEQYLDSLYTDSTGAPVAFPDGLETRDPLVAEPSPNPR